jgi:hypothetical protein
VVFLGIKAVEYEHKWKHGLLWGTLYQPQVHEAEHSSEPDRAHETEEESGASDTASVDLDTPDMKLAEQHRAPAVTGVQSQAGDESAPQEYAEGTDGDGAAEVPPSGDAAMQVEKSQITPAPAGPSGLAHLPDTGQPIDYEHIQDQPENVHLFFGIYFAMTGLHALHVIVGMVLIFVIMILSVKGRYSSEYYTPVDLTGLYWHLVDLIWIFLFPLLYLIH